VKERKESESNKFAVTVPCNDDCFFNRRLEALASLSKTKNEKFLYSLSLWDIAQRDPRAVQKVERQLSEFADSKEQVVSLPPANSSSRALVHSLAKYFHITSEGVDMEPHRSCLLTKTGTTALPPVLLSNAVKDSQLDPLEFLTQRAKPSMKEKLCLIVTGAQVNEIVITTLLNDLIGRFVVAPPEIGEDGRLSFLVAFTTQKRADEAMKRLEAANSQHTLSISRATH
jgi:transcriptional repressor NF-X1